MSNTSHSRSSEVIGVNAALLSISCLVVSLRLVSRWLSAARFWWDDACIILSLLFLFGSSTFNFVAAANGAGKHVVSPSQMVTLYKIIYGSEILYGPHITAIKSSILLLYLRLFGVRKTFRIAILGTEALVVAWCIADLFSGIFQANPISAFWYPNKPHTQIDYNKYTYAPAIPNVVTDFVILVLPISMVWQLRISKRRKMALCGVFLLGTFVCVVSIIRAYEVAAFDKHDASYAFARTLLWSSVEVNVGIICACLPVLQPVIQIVFGEVLGGSEHLKHALHTSRQETGTHDSSATAGASKAQFRRLDDDVINQPPKAAIHDTWVSAESHSDGTGEFSQAIPLNAIHVKRNVELLNGPRN